MLGSQNESSFLDFFQPALHFVQVGMKLCQNIINREHPICLGCFEALDPHREHWDNPILLLNDVLVPGFNSSLFQAHRSFVEGFERWHIFCRGQPHRASEALVGVGTLTQYDGRAHPPTASVCPRMPLRVIWASGSLARGSPLTTLP